VFPNVVQVNFSGNWPIAGREPMRSLTREAELFPSPGQLAGKLEIEISLGALRDLRGLFRQDRDPSAALGMNTH
jgi:hypothetical protein